GQERRTPAAYGRRGDAGGGAAEPAAARPAAPALRGGSRHLAGPRTGPGQPVGRVRGHVQGRPVLRRVAGGHRRKPAPGRPRAGPAMSRYALDTDTLSLWQHGHPAVSQRVAARRPDELTVTVITVQEQLDGW